MSSQDSSEPQVPIRAVPQKSGLVGLGLSRLARQQDGRSHRKEQQADHHHPRRVAVRAGEGQALASGRHGLRARDRFGRDETRSDDRGGRHR